MGKTKDGFFGIDKIMDICDNFEIKVLFFVDFAEAWDYGEDRIKSIVTHIANRGHDIGVHIHPDHMADHKRLFLYEYSKQEQYEIIKKCTNLYQEFLGEKPKAFRAGKYGANRDTLDVFNELGYEFDFSQFYKQKWCGINPPITLISPVKYKGIIEIPVTVYRSLKIGRYERFDKLDAVMDKHELKYMIKKYSNQIDDIIGVLFYHSFSMLEWRDAPDNPVANKKEINKFIDALEFINKTKNLQFISLKELEKKININNPSQKMLINKNFFTSFFFSIIRYINIKKMRKMKKMK